MKSSPIKGVVFTS